MSKSYFNNAMAGNSKMLCSFSEKGELLRLFWPNIDFPQHSEDFHIGISDSARDDAGSSALWFHSDFINYCQEYIPQTNIIKTTYDSGDGLAISQSDYVIFDLDVLIRSFKIECVSKELKKGRFIVYSSAEGTELHPQSALFDFENDAIVHYRHNNYIAVGADKEITCFQLGNNARDSAAWNNLKGTDNIITANDCAFSCDLGDIEQGGSKTVTLYICAAHTLKDVQKLMVKMKQHMADYWLEATRRFWIEQLEAAAEMKTSDMRIDRLYERTVLYFHLVSDKNTGGILASAEVDEHRTICGGYGYCWGRDAAFIINAFDICGMKDQADKFFEWTRKTQDNKGYWHQRYYMDGNIAPSWGLQIDETASIVWGILQHYETVGDREFLEKSWDSVQQAVDYIISAIDAKTGLPEPSFDLWEERFGEHSYSAAAVYGGIQAGVSIAHLLGKSQERTEQWSVSAQNMKEAILSNMWNGAEDLFLRSVKVKMNPWGPEYSENKTLIRYNEKGYCKEVTLEDKTVDASLYGLAVPFSVLEPCDHRMKSTAARIESALSFGKGLGRYAGDTYAGGNPWIITTLWAALYHIQAGNLDKALEYFYWSIDKVTETGLLPEQVGKDSGKPAWVFGLTWSHAMFVLVLDKLLKAGYLRWAD